MPISPPLTELKIRTAERGFYKGFTKDVTITAKLLVGGLIVWAVGFPESASAYLGKINSYILASFNHWYIYVMGLYLLMCLALAIMPSTGRLKLGTEADKPEFSRFSWFSMMFGAGLGIGMLTYSTGEPLYHFQNNPDVIRGVVEGGTAENVRSAYKWTFWHWGLSAWGCYALSGLAISYFSYRRGLPLTIRSAVASLFGRRLSGKLGHTIDVTAVVAIVLGVAQVLGYGVEQFVAGMHRIGLGDWLIKVGPDGAQSASTFGILFAIAIIVGGSTLSALSGVGRGIKWLSNISMGLNWVLLATFLLVGSTFFGLHALAIGIWDYVVSLPSLLFAVWTDDGGATEAELASWQASWTVFYWAWWISFAPFVGMFLARISKGRSIREYILGSMVAPSLMCFIWFGLVGGTAIDLELSGQAQGAILGTGISDQLYATIAVMFEPGMALAMSALVVTLLLTYQVTSADSAILVINTINAAGDDSPKSRPHILFWGLAMAVVVSALLMIGGLGAIQTAMVIGALPFSLVLLLMGISVIRAIIRDGMRKRESMQMVAVQA